MKECLKKAKAIQKIIENKIMTDNGETVNPVIRSMKEITQNENIGELENLSMKIDSKKCLYLKKRPV